MCSTCTFAQHKLGQKPSQQHRFDCLLAEISHFNLADRNWPDTLETSLTYTNDTSTRWVGRHGTLQQSCVHRHPSPAVNSPYKVIQGENRCISNYLSEHRISTFINIKHTISAIFCPSVSNLHNTECVISPDGNQRRFN